MGLHYVRGTTELDLQRSDLGVFLEIQEGLDELPDFRGQDDLVPFRSGRLRRDRWADGRRILLVGIIDDELPATLRGYVDEVKAALAPAAGGGVLVEDLEDGTTRWIRVTPTSFLAPRLGPNARRVSAELSAFDPYWYAADGTLAMDAGLEADDGYTLDSSGELVVVPTGSPASFVLAAQGTASCQRIRVRLEGPSAGDLTVENATLAVGFIFPELADGDVLELDGFARTVTVGGTNRRSDLELLAGNRHGEYLRLEPGANQLRIFGQPARARLLYTPSYQ